MVFVIVNCYVVPGRGAKYYDQHVMSSLCMSACLSARKSKNACQNVNKKFSAHVTGGRGSANTLHTSGFVDDIMFSHNGAKGAASIT